MELSGEIGDRRDRVVRGTAAELRPGRQRCGWFSECCGPHWAMQNLHSGLWFCLMTCFQGDIAESHLMSEPLESVSQLGDLGFWNCVFLSPR